MKIGIVGLPNVGKSALFNALTGACVDSQNYPFCTIEPNVNTVKVQDFRILELSKIYNSKKLVYAVVEFVDIAGIVRGASKGEGLGNKFLANIREVDAIIHVVRCFKNSDIGHVDGSVSPIRDIQTINLELILSDIDAVTKKIEKTKKNLKADKKYEDELFLWNRLLKHLEKEQPARLFTASDEEWLIIRDAWLLTNKPVLYIANIDENSFLAGLESDINYNEVKNHANLESAKILPICAQFEEQISTLEDEEKNEFLKEIGLTETGLNKVIDASYDTLNLISFLTAGPEETRAWTIKKGTTASVAAGKIHSDIQKGFIRAEIVSYENLIKYGSINVIKEKGLLSLEGRDYIMKDGDVVLFRFNV